MGLGVGDEGLAARVAGMQATAVLAATPRRTFSTLKPIVGTVLSTSPMCSL